MFPCTGCGVCCKQLALVQELQAFDRGDGVCRYLDEKTHFCKIYSIRPEICRVDVMYAKYFATRYSQEEFYRLNAKACNAMQEEQSLDERFRIKMEDLDLYCR